MMIGLGGLAINRFLAAIGAWWLKNRNKLLPTLIGKDTDDIVDDVEERSQLRTQPVWMWNLSEVVDEAMLKLTTRG